MTETKEQPDVTVVVIAICSLPQLERAIRAIEDQVFDGTVEVIVAADPRLGELTALRSKFPRCVFLFARRLSNADRADGDGPQLGEWRSGSADGG